MDKATNYNIPANSEHETETRMQKITRTRVMYLYKL